MKPYKISLLGVGLIGGSLGLAIKSSRPDVEITGHASQRTLLRALERGAIDIAAFDPVAAVTDADVVFINTPLGVMKPLMKEIAPYLKKGAIVTDVGSVKHHVVNDAKKCLPPNVTFIAGHPMAGTEQKGVDNADQYLFQNAVYALAIPAAAPKARVKRFIDLIQSTGARIILIDPHTHDQVAAAISHLPQLLSVALVNTVDALGDKKQIALQLAAGGFRDMTRIASSPYEMWHDIFEQNRTQVLKTIDLFLKQLLKLRKSVDKQDKQLQHAFIRANELRSGIKKNSKGFITPLQDVFINLEDKPGSLFTTTKLMADNKINIKDLELLKVREGFGGTFRISFDTQAHARKAVKIFRSHGIQARMES